MGPRRAEGLDGGAGDRLLACCVRVPARRRGASVAAQARLAGGRGDGRHGWSRETTRSSGGGEDDGAASARSRDRGPWVGGGRERRAGNECLQVRPARVLLLTALSDNSGRLRLENPMCRPKMG
jgi:hypothetical protein